MCHGVTNREGKEKLKILSYMKIFLAPAIANLREKLSAPFGLSLRIFMFPINQQIGILQTKYARKFISQTNISIMLYKKKTPIQYSAIFKSINYVWFYFSSSHQEYSTIDLQEIYKNIFSKHKSNKQTLPNCLTIDKVTSVQTT